MNASKTKIYINEKKERQKKDVYSKYTNIVTKNKTKIFDFVNY